MQTNTVPSTDALAARLESLDSLRQDWDRLKASRPHLHNPEAARILGVPEAALVASRLGSGAIRLPANPLEILAPIAEWRRVLVAVSNSLGVSLALGQVEDVGQYGDAIRLSGQHLHTEFSAASVANAYWFVEVDENHGRTRSLQFSDAAGQDIAKVFLFHKTAAAAAERRFRELAEPVEQAAFRPAAMPHSVGLFTPDRDLPGIVDRLATPGPQAFRAVFEQLGALQAAVCVDTFAARASQRFRGRVTHARMDEVMVHLHEPDIRMHLRPNVLQGAQARRLDDRLVAVEFTDADGLSLRLSSPDNPQAFDLWARKTLAVLS